MIKKAQSIILIILTVIAIVSILLYIYTLQDIEKIKDNSASSSETALRIERNTSMRIERQIEELSDEEKFDFSDWN